MSNTTYIFRWDRHGRKGQRCIVLARGTMNSCLVRFEDGYTMVTAATRSGDRHPHLDYLVAVDAHSRSQ